MRRCRRRTQRRSGDGAVTRDDVIRTLAIKGYVTADLLAPALGVSSEEAAELLDRLAADGIVTGSSGMFSLSADGKALGAEMLAVDARPGVSRTRLPPSMASWPSTAA